MKPDAADARQVLWAEYKRTGAALKAYPKTAIGLTPDAVKASPEYKLAKQAHSRAFAALRAFNSKRAA